MGHTLFLTGHPGVGKTTVIKQAALALGARAGGFYTEELRGAGGRKGFRLITLDGQETTMAHVDIRGRHRVGRYGVDVEAINRVGVAAIRQALGLRQVVVIDEIGKMELFSDAFRAIVFEALMSSGPIVATVMQKPHAWVDALKTMHGVTLWQVTQANRDELPARVLAWLDKATGRD
jgi:nucleoside-triphosphatase